MVDVAVLIVEGRDGAEHHVSCVWVVAAVVGAGGRVGTRVEEWRLMLFGPVKESGAPWCHRASCGLRVVAVAQVGVGERRFDKLG